MTRFWWVRHGPTHANCMLGWSDLPADLSNTSALAWLAASLPAGAPVVSSDLCRAVATADAIAGGRPRLPNEPGLRELNFGRWELKRFAEVEAEDAERIRAFYERPGEVRAPGGETWNETRARVAAAVERLRTEHDGGDLVLVAHMGAILSQLQGALGLSPYDTFARTIDNLSVTVLEYDVAWHAVSVNQRP